MNFNEYQEQSLATAIYPNRGKNLAYTTLGLIEETGEVVEKLTTLDREGLIKEIGDQCWYIANTCSELQVPMETLRVRMETIVCPAQDAELTNLMLVEASKLAGKAKKVIRDDNGLVTEDKKVKSLDHLATILAAISCLAENHNLSLVDIMAANLKKLLDRKARNVLQGSGDNR